MIPKIIHRVWMSEDLPDKNTLFGKYFYSQDKLKDYGYEIRTYNSHNFDFSISPYLLQAYALKKWAFVTDYIRFWIIYHFGGIYLDGDVEVYKNFDELLDMKYFFSAVYKTWENQEERNRNKNFPMLEGFYAHGGIFFDPAMFGAEKNNILIKKFLDLFKTRNFIDKDGNIDYLILDCKVSQVIWNNYYNKHLINDFEEYKNLVNYSDLNKDIYVLNTEYLADIDTDYHDHPNSICAHQHMGTWLRNNNVKIKNFNNFSDEEKEEYYARYERYKLTSIEFNKVYTFNDYNKYLDLFKTDNFEIITEENVQNVIENTDNICFINFDKINDMQLFKYMLKNLPKDKKCISINSNNEVIYNDNITLNIIKENIFTCIYK